MGDLTKYRKCCHPLKEMNPKEGKKNPKKLKPSTTRVVQQEIRSASQIHLSQRKVTRVALHL